MAPPRRLPRPGRVVSYVVVEFTADGRPSAVMAGAEVFADVGDAADARTDCESALDGTGRTERYEVCRLVPVLAACIRPQREDMTGE